MSEKFSDLPRLLYHFQSGTCISGRSGNQLNAIVVALVTTMLIKLLDQQLSEDPDPRKELGCQSLHIHSMRGALFKITLWSHG